MNKIEKNQQNSEPIKNDITDLVFECKCSNCNVYPIICKMFYCDKCKINFCQECENILSKHIHPLIIIESKKQLYNIKEKEKEIIEQKIKDENIKSTNLNINMSKITNCSNNFDFKRKIIKARMLYDLRGISDKELADALIKTNGDIDEAIIFLYK